MRADFDLDDLIEVIDAQLGEGAGERTIEQVKNQAKPSLAGLDLSPDDYVKDDAYFTEVLDRTLQILSFSAGPQQTEMIVRRIGHFGRPIAGTLRPPVPKPVPASEADYQDQINDLNQYLQDTFNGDAEMQDVINTAYERLVNDMVGVPTAIGPNGFSAPDPARMMPRGPQWEGVTTEMYMDLIRSVAREMGGDREIISESLLSALEGEWQSGRADLPFDHPDRDPTGILSPIEQENRSPRVRILLGEEPIELREVSFTNPVDVMGFDELLDVERAQLEDFIQSLPPGLNPTQRAQFINNQIDGYLRSRINQMWETGPLAGEFDINELGYSRESFTDEFLAGLKAENEAKLRSYTEADGSGNTFAQADAASMGLVADFREHMNSLSRQMAAANDPLARGGAPVSLGELQRFYNEMPDDQFRQVQMDLFLAGAYGENARPEDIPFGDKTDTTAWEAWNGAIRESGIQARRGQKVYVEDVFERMRSGALGAREDQIRALRQNAADTIRAGQDAVTANFATITVSDPRLLVDNADAIARRILGRNATPDERRILIAAVQDQQRTNKRAQVRAQASSLANSYQREAERFIDEANRLAFEETEAGIRQGTVTDEQIRRGASQDVGLGGLEAIGIREGELARARAEAGIEEPGGDPLEGLDPAAIGGGGGIQEIQEFDANAYMEDWLMENNAEEARSHQIRQGFGSFLKALQSPIQM